MEAIHALKKDVESAHTARSPSRARQNEGDKAEINHKWGTMETLYGEAWGHMK
jgi:hypothetical protein